MGVNLFPLGGASGVAFDPLAFDCLADRGGKLRKRGKLLSYSSFDGGNYGNWRNHVSSSEPRPPLGMATYPTIGGASHSLVVSTGERPYVAGNRDTGSGTYQNLASWDGEDSVVSISMFYAIHSGLSAPAWGSFGLALDMQKFDGSSRSFPSLVWGWSSGAAEPTARIKMEGGAFRPLTSSAPHFVGENEGKYNWGYMRLTYDRAANNGLGGYLEAQLNSKIIDLTSLNSEVGPASEPPQTGGYGDSFNGGLNGGIVLNASSTNPTSYPARLYVGQVVMTTGDRKAA